MDPEFVRTCQEMADLTLPKCRKCRAPLSCCDLMYCDMARERAEEEGIKLNPVSDGPLPFLGPDGCVVPPRLRILCTVHVCSINDLGYDPEDPDWTRRYFRLREKINRLIEREDWLRALRSKCKTEA